MALGQAEILVPEPAIHATTAISTSTAPKHERMPLFGDLFKPLPGDFKHMASQQNLFLVTLGAAAVTTSHSVDGRVALSGWGNGTVHQTLAPGQVVGAFLVQTGGAFATYAVGRVTNKPRIAIIGAELVRAGFVAQGTTQMVKFATSRTRPDGTSHSFPSGHTASAFATASVLQSELGWKAGAPAYAIAAWVAASRVQMERHYLSDVIAGATVGILAGRSVTIGRGAARFSVAPTVVPGGVGVNFVKTSN